MLWKCKGYCEEFITEKLYGDRKLQIMKFETKRSNSIKDKNQLLFFPTLVIKFLLPS